MTYGEHEKYWRPARESIFGELEDKMNYSHSKQLADLFGYDYTRAGNWDTIVLTDELKKKLKLLAGPHGKTIFKMMQLKKEGAIA